MYATGEELSSTEHGYLMMHGHVLRTGYEYPTRDKLSTSLLDDTYNQVKEKVRRYP